MRRAIVALAAVLVVAVTGCSVAVAGEAAPAGSGSSDGDQAMVQEYYDLLNDAADEGEDALRQYLARTQHPDFTDRLCDLGGLTLHMVPAMSTFRPDPDWVPPEADDPPRGVVYVLGVSISVREDGALLGEQIGSQRVVVLDGRAYGFSPCPLGQ
jgi:hypothetical protein